MRPPKDFFRPLAIGAPEPLREIPFRPSRVIHFLPPHIPKMVAKVPDIAPTVDVLLANLEDGVPATDKARRVLGFEATTSLDEMLDEVVPWITTAIAEGLI